MARRARMQRQERRHRVISEQQAPMQRVIQMVLMTQLAAMMVMHKDNRAQSMLVLVVILKHN